MKFKKGDIVQRVGGFENSYYNYRGEQIYLIKSVDEHWYEGYLYLCLDGIWMRTDAFEYEIKPLEPRFKKWFKPAIISIFREEFS